MVVISTKREARQLGLIAAMGKEPSYEERWGAMQSLCISALCIDNLQWKIKGLKPGYHHTVTRFFRLLPLALLLKMGVFKEKDAWFKALDLAKAMSNTKAKQTTPLIHFARFMACFSISSPKTPRQNRQCSGVADTTMPSRSA